MQTGCQVKNWYLKSTSPGPKGICWWQTASSIQGRNRLVNFNVNFCLTVLFPQLLKFKLLFNVHVPGQPSLACTRMSPFWISLELRITEVMATTRDISRAKLQSMWHHRQINTNTLQAGFPSCRPKNSVSSNEGKISLLPHRKLTWESCIVTIINLLPVTESGY